MIVTFHRNQIKFLHHKYSTFSWVSELLFQVCIQTHIESLQDSLWGQTAEGTGHCKCRVCSPLWSWGKQQPGSSGNVVPCWGVCTCSGRTGRRGLGGMGVAKKIYCFLLLRTHTQRQACFHAEMSSAKQNCNGSSSPAAGGAVKPAHQGHAFCSCRNLHRALAWRTPCPMLHTDKVLLFFHRKRKGACKPICGGNTSHLLPWQ